MEVVFIKLLLRRDIYEAKRCLNVDSLFCVYHSIIVIQNVEEKKELWLIAANFEFFHPKVI